MKKILSFVLAVCLIIPCSFMLTACGNDNYFGETRKYQYESMSLKCPTQEEKDQILKGLLETIYLSQNYTGFEGSIIEFDKKGNVIQKSDNNNDFKVEYFYKIEDGLVKIYRNKDDENLIVEMKIDGKKLIQKLYNYNLVGSGLSYVEIVYALVD